jgi:hypothetical protein
MTVYRVYNRRFESYHRPGDPPGVMSSWDRAGTWDDKTEAEAVAETLNERDRKPEYGDLGGDDDWVVVDDREPPRPI